MNVYYSNFQFSRSTTCSFWDVMSLRFQPSLPHNLTHHGMRIQKDASLETSDLKIRPCRYASQLSSIPVIPKSNFINTQRSSRVFPCINSQESSEYLMDSYQLRLSIPFSRIQQSQRRRGICSGQFLTSTKIKTHVSRH